MDERGGVLLRYAGGGGRSALGFVPADVAARLVSLSSLTPVPGARPPALGIALAEGAVVTVLEVGRGVAQGDPDGDEWPVPGADRALLCRVGGLDLALTGGVVLATGVFDATSQGGVFWRGEPVPALDVAALYAQAEAASWAERAAVAAPRTAGLGVADDGRWTLLPEPPGGPGSREGERS
jgi:hypothetical protein